jgi:hypothetical protein
MMTSVIVARDHGHRAWHRLRIRSGRRHHGHRRACADASGGRGVDILRGAVGRIPPCRRLKTLAGFWVAGHFQLRLGQSSGYARSWRPVRDGESDDRTSPTPARERQQQESGHQHHREFRLGHHRYGRHAELIVACPDGLSIRCIVGVVEIPIVD